MKKLIVLVLFLSLCGCASASSGTTARPSSSKKIVKPPKTVVVFPFSDARSGSANYGITPLDTKGSGETATECFKSMLYGQAKYFEVVAVDSVEDCFKTTEVETRNFMGMVGKTTLKERASYEEANAIAASLGADLFILGKVTNYSQSMHTSVGAAALIPFAVSSVKVRNLSQASTHIELYEVGKRAPLFSKTYSAESVEGFHGAFEKIATKAGPKVKKYR